MYISLYVTLFIHANVITVFHSVKLVGRFPDRWADQTNAPYTAPVWLAKNFSKTVVQVDFFQFAGTLQLQQGHQIH